MIARSVAKPARPARDEVRLRMKPGTGARGCVDGAWWPHTVAPAQEFPGLVLVMSSWVGPVSRVAYHLADWDAAAHRLVVEGWPVMLSGVSYVETHTVVVTGPNQRRMSLLVVPPSTPGRIARAILESAAAPATVASVADILASNGFRPAAS